MSNKITLAITNIETPVIVEDLVADSSLNLKIGLVIPTDFLAFTLTVLLLVQNAK